MEIKLKSKMYRFYELRAEIKNALDNAEKLIKQYDALIDIVEKSDRKEEINENFIEGVKSNKADLEKQVKVLSERIVYIGYLIENYEKKDDFSAKIDQIVSLAFEAIGLTGDDDLEDVEDEETTEEVKDTKEEA